MKKKIRFLQDNFIFYLTGLLVILGLKCYYRQADCDSLLWILGPTAHWVTFLSKIPFTYVSGTGYVNHSLRMVIAPSCSGVRFMTITFAMLVFSFVHMSARQVKPVSESAKSGEPGRKVRGLGWIAASAFLSWIITIFVNGLRIITAIYLPLCLEATGLMRGILTQDRLHTMIGVAVYFAALLVVYRLAGWFVQNVFGVAPVFRENCESSAHSENTCTDVVGNRFLPLFARKCMAPLFWYFALTLGLPFISRICRGNITGFTEFAALVSGSCVIVLLLYSVVLLFHRHRWH